MLILGFAVTPARATTDSTVTSDPLRTEVLDSWYRLILELVRHTPTYSPPVASRAFAYTGITAFEVTASDPTTGLLTLAGQVNGLTDIPARDPAAVYSEPAILHAALTAAVETFFANTGPTGQRARAAMTKALSRKVEAGVPDDVALRSAAYGRAVAEHIIAWSNTDGGAVITNLGFPYEFTLGGTPASWVPTSPIALQQRPLLPDWGKVRPFAMPAGSTCHLPPPPAYDETPGSAFYNEAKEVYDTTRALTDEQRLTARFWSDDPMLSPTPPGHWVSIVLQIARRDNLDIATRTDALARVGIAVADGFIGCWHTKFEYDLLRPVTYIRRVIDPKWDPLLITPPFPEYPSGHSTQSGAAATVLTALFGEDFAFDDATHADDGLPVRSFPSFRAAAEEAAMSRLYGGIHFRAAIEQGLAQGRCIGAYAAALVTRK